MGFIREEAIQRYNIRMIKEALDSKLPYKLLHKILTSNFLLFYYFNGKNKASIDLLRHENLSKFALPQLGDDFEILSFQRVRPRC